LSENPDTDIKEKINSSGWRQTGFSFFTDFSVALLFSYLTGPRIISFRLFLPVLILSLLFSVFYFIKSFKRILRKSGESAGIEFFLYLIFVVLSALVLLINSAGFVIAASAAGIILLTLNDLKCALPDKRIITYLHSGQNLLTVLIMASFLSGLKAPFIFIAVIKLISSTYKGYCDKPQNVYFSFRILRIAVLLAAGISLVTGISYSDPVITAIFLSGELLDRIIYYHDLEIKNGSL
jgi:hypothetical protein